MSARDKDPRFIVHQMAASLVDNRVDISSVKDVYSVLVYEHKWRFPIRGHISVGSFLGAYYENIISEYMNQLESWERSYGQYIPQKKVL